MPQLRLVAGAERDANRCINSFPRDQDADQPIGSMDGLFMYDEAQRRNAAEKLHEYIKLKAQNKIAEKMPGIVSAMGGASLAVSFMMASMATPVAIIAAAFGITAEEAADLVVLFTDLPDDVANQVLNAFASDWCDTAAKDSEKWRNPGSGESVSPDNIIRSWSANLKADDEWVIGLYGRNRAAIIRPAQWAQRPITAWAVSAGPSHMQGTVTFGRAPH